MLRKPGKIPLISLHALDSPVDLTLGAAQSQKGAVWGWKTEKRRPRKPEKTREIAEKEYVKKHSSILACGIPWTEEPGRLQSLGSQRVGHDLVTKQQQTTKCVL